MTEKTIELPDKILSTLSDAKRLATLSEIGAFDGSPSEAFNGLAMMASLVFNAPIAQVTFLDAETQLFKSSLGIDIDVAPVNTSFCAHTFGTPNVPMVVLDASKDKRFANNPYVIGEPHVRFYAGCPILVEDQPIGTVCVYDFKPRESITTTENKMIQLLARNGSHLLVEE